FLSGDEITRGDVDVFVRKLPTLRALAPSSGSPSTALVATYQCSAEGPFTVNGQNNVVAPWPRAAPPRSAASVALAEFCSGCRDQLPNTTRCSHDDKLLCGLLAVLALDLLLFVAGIVVSARATDGLDCRSDGTSTSLLRACFGWAGYLGL